MITLSVLNSGFAIPKDFRQSVQFCYSCCPLDRISEF